jgi:methyltransferase (TIGR00027 family)
MIQGTPSRTALAAARHRALHQIAEQGGILADPFALRILASEPAEADAAAADIEAARPMRLFIALRSRFADDCVRNARARGVTQIVVLGAGLDLTAFRLESEEGVTIFEVDHPDTQAWKQSLLREAGMVVPDMVRFVPVDFEHEQLWDRLAANGFVGSRPAIFIWLGVTPYLTIAAILATLRFVAGLQGGAEIVFDYGEPLDTLQGAAREARLSRMAQVAAMGEPWISLFHPAAMQDILRGQGFRHVEDRSLWETAALYNPHSPKGDGGGGHIVRACNFEVMA